MTAKRRLALPWLGRDRAADAAQEEQRVADALYGLIVGAAVMAASHAPGTGRVAVSVLVTLLVYWSAERYAAILAGRIAAGHRRPGSLRHELTDGWGLLTSSFIPTVVLLAFDLFGAGVRTSVLAALVCSTGLLCLAGLQIGAAGRLSATERMISATAAGSFGLVLIALKVALH